MNARTPQDRSVLDETTAALTAGTATAPQIRSAYAIIDQPLDGDRSPSEDAIVDAALELGELQRSHLDEAFSASAAATRPPFRKNRRQTELYYDVPEASGFVGQAVRQDRIEHLLIWLADGPDSLSAHFMPHRRKAVRQGLIRNTGQTTGLGNCDGTVQWIYELTDKGREMLAAYDAAVAAQTEQVSA